MSTGSWPTGGGFPSIIGIGGPGGYDDEGEPVKKFTSADCLEKLLESIANDPLLVRQHIQIFQSTQADLLNKTLWPEIFKEENWTRTATKRPSHDDAGEKLIGSDREVRVYENDVWSDYGKRLEGTVTCEHGAITEVKVEVKW